MCVRVSELVRECVCACVCVFLFVCVGVFPWFFVCFYVFLPKCFFSMLNASVAIINILFYVV